MGYFTVAGEGRSRESVRGSDFLAVALPVATETQAASALERIRTEHADASHNAYGYRLGDRMRFDDDGEPGGTAGRPILEVILKRDLDMVLVVVTRYFGGTKLGAGGLVRAYGGAAARALDAAGVREVEDTASLKIGVPYPAVDAAKRLLSGLEGVSVRQESFDRKGWQVDVVVPVTHLDELKRRITDLTSGEAELEVGRSEPSRPSPGDG